MNINWKKECKNPMNIEEHLGVTFLTFEQFKETKLVKHGFSTRLGGVSEGIYGTMNFGFNRGDDENCVLENYKRMAAALDVDVHKIVTTDQTHTTNVRLVTESDCGKGLFRTRDYTDVDGLLTNVPGITLYTSYADCVPLFFIDPVHKAIALSHSGWRGTVNKMGAVTLRAMETEFGTNASDVIAAIGPSICQDCYEISEDVATQFAKEFPDHILKKGRITEEGQKYQLDLWSANEWILLNAGVKRENISLPGICTCCNPDFLFSHRASNGKRGNLGAFLCLK